VAEKMSDIVAAYGPAGARETKPSFKRGLSLGSLAVLLICFADEAAAQIGPIDAGKCGSDLDVLNARIDKLNAACCINPQTTAKENQCHLEACDAECVSVMIPLLDECQQLLDVLYDGADGKYDGHAQAFSTVYAQCLAMPTSEVLDGLKALAAKGQCPDTVLDGVAAAEVAAPVCEDTWLNAAGCEVGVLSGLLSCERDFCDTAPTPAAPCGYSEQQTGGSGGSLEPPGSLLEPPGPILTHLHTVQWRILSAFLRA
jgi:hypothetical protein